MTIKNYNWFILRFSGILFMFSYLMDFELTFIFFNFLFLHINSGLKTIFFDYIHIKKLAFFLFSLLRISLIINLTQILEIFF